MILSGTTRLGVAAAAAVLLSTGTTAGPAQAAAPAAGSGLSTRGAMAPVQLPGDKTARTYTDADIRSFERTGGDPAVLAYWTADRMAAAKPLDVPGDAVRVEDTARAVAAKAPEIATSPAAAKHAEGKAAAAPPPVTNWSITNGKLFSNGYESGSWCSAAAVNTPSGRVLITAGHCVHSGKGGAWKSNVVFVPKYNAFNADHDPVGRFQAYRLRTFDEWINNSNLNRDVGWVTTYSGGDWNDTVVNTVGGHGLAYNGGTEFDVSVFGYPSNKDNGERMWACWGTAADSSDQDDRSAIGCDFGPGSSGGPWLWKYDNDSGLGYVRSVMSTLDTDGVNRGPYFDTAVNDGTDAADNDW